MRLMNPMSALKYMGGSVPIHLAFVAIECIVLAYPLGASDGCEDLYFDWFNQSSDTKEENINDIVYMIVAHAICFLFGIFKICLRSQE